MNVPDYDILPDLFAARTVEFRAGAEISLLNHLTRVLAWLARHNAVRSFSRYAPALRRAMAVLGPFGHDWGAIGVEADGSVDGRRMARRVCIVAEHCGERIPIMPAVIMVRKLISEASGFHGLVPVDTWITRDELHAECARRGYRLTVQELPVAR